jgi:hypothetical protein
MASSHQARPVQALWRVRCSDGWAHAEIWTHSIGWECRVYWDGELQRSQAYRDLAEADRDAADTKARLEGYAAERRTDDRLLPHDGPPDPAAGTALSPPTLSDARARFTEAGD